MEASHGHLGVPEAGLLRPEELIIVHDPRRVDDVRGPARQRSAARRPGRRGWCAVAMAAGALLAIGVALLLATFWARRAARRLDMRRRAGTAA